MSWPGTKEDRARKGPAKAQAQKLLRTLCNFMLPITQRAGMQKTMRVKNFDFGTEAEEFVIELEKFISHIISGSQLRSHNVIIETTGTLGKDSFDYMEEASWLWDSETPAPDDEAISDGGSDDDRNPEYFFRDTDSDSFQDFETEEDNLQHLRSHITQKMPIRLLCFVPHNSSMKISLLERADIYTYLAPKFLASDMMIYDWLNDYAGYAILSHTWTQTPGELTYRDWQSGLVLNNRHPKCQKLINFCKAAWEDHRITLGWIDTVCINKESSSELDESIRSMFAWYRNAAICVTYLAETNRLSDMRNDRWFSRGWTFQELVAPRYIKFYNTNWKQLAKRNIEQDHRANDKQNDLILGEIRHATTITRDELNNHIWNISISRRMQLAAQRQVTRQEDMAYCLMGIFDVSISTAYGEGAERAFFRLVEEIFRTTKDVSDIFNWAGDRYFPSITSLFPSSPSNYLNCFTNESGFSQWCSWRPVEPLTLTHLGLRTPILLMPARPSRESASGHQPIGKYSATVSISPLFSVYPEVYHLLDKAASEPQSSIQLPWDELQKLSLTFGTLNVEAEGTSTRIPKKCLAVLLERPWNKGAETSVGYDKVPTEKPIVFDLEKTDGNDGDKPYYQIERSELAQHGMEMVTLYL